MVVCGLCGKEMIDNDKVVERAMVVSHASDHNKEMQILGMDSMEYVDYCHRRREGNV